MKRDNSRSLFGFTIVELLVVIVVIGILAAVTIVSYTGITNKAMLASLSSDLDGASRQLKLFQTINSAYPATISLNCATTPDTTTNKCLKLSPGNTITSLTGDYIVNNTTNPQTFSLTIKNTSSATIAVITDNSKPAVLTPAPLSPVADWLATYQGDHYGNFYDSVSHAYATVTRTTPKTVYDSNTQHIYDVPNNKLGVRPRSDGKGGSEAVIEEARTNYTTNSYGAVNSGGKWIDTGWDYNPGNLAGTPTYSITQGAYSNTASRFQYTGVAGDNNSNMYTGFWTPSGSFAAGDNFTISFYVKGSVSGCAVQVYMDAWSDSAFLGNTTLQFTPTSNYNLITFTMSNLPTGTTHVRGVPIQIYNINPGSTADITFDAVQIEKGAFATSYIPTTTATVTRNADVVTVPTTNWNASTGTLVAVRGAQVQSSWMLVGWRADSNNSIYLGSGGSLGTAAISNRASGVSTMSQNSTGSVLNAYAVLAGKWQSTGVRAYTNSVDATASGAINTPTGLPATANVGSYNSANYPSGPIQRLVVYSSALSDSDVTTITNAVKDGT